MRAASEGESNGAPSDDGDREVDIHSRVLMRSPSEKAPGETESSGSASSPSERFSDYKEAFKISPDDAQSPEVSSHVESGSNEEEITLLKGKLSAALRKVRAKEDLAKQHAKVAEEAVSGWEKAEKEAASLKQQLEAAFQNNSALEDRIAHLDSALKECVRELRQSKEDQEQRARLWESEKNDLENLLEAEKGAFTSSRNSIQTKVDALEKENEYLKSELLAQSDELDVRTLERELSTQAAEIASKQHLESIKKVAKLEAECLRLRASVCKKSFGDHKPVGGHVSVDSLTDSQSDCGDRVLSLDNEPSASDSWASALIAELDQFKAAARNPNVPSLEIDLMDDFVQMEKLAAMTEPSVEREGGGLQLKMSELEEKIQVLEAEKADLEGLLHNTQDRLEKASEQLDDLQRERLDVESLERERDVLESEVKALRKKVGELERKVEEESALSADLACKCRNLEEALLHGELKAKQDRELAVAAGKLAECQKTIASLGQQLRSLANLDDALIEEEGAELDGGARVLQESANGPNLPNGREDVQSPSSSSSSSLSGHWRSVSEQGQHSHLHL